MEVIEYGFFVKKLMKYESIYVLFSQVTKMPYIECDEESLDDEIFAFVDQARLQEEAKKYTARKIVLVAGQIKQEMFENFFKSLHALGVTAVMVQEEGAPMRIPLEELARKPEGFEEGKKKPIPEVNPEVQLTAIYFMQELNRPVERSKTQKKELRALEEEMAVNLMRSKFIHAVDITGVKNFKPGVPNQKVKIPFVKTKNGDIYQPVYTEIGEFKKFNNKVKQTNGKYQLSVCTYDQLERHLLPQSKGFVINPAGFNLRLSKEQLELMKTRYGLKDEK